MKKKNTDESWSGCSVTAMFTAGTGTPANHNFQKAFRSEKAKTPRTPPSHTTAKTVNTRRRKHQYTGCCRLALAVSDARMNGPAWPRLLGPREARDSNSRRLSKAPLRPSLSDHHEMRRLRQCPTPPLSLPFLIFAFAANALFLFSTRKCGDLRAVVSLPLVEQRGGEVPLGALQPPRRTLLQPDVLLGNCAADD